MNEVELWKFVQVEDSRGKSCNQDVSWLVVRGSGQVVKIALLVEEMSTQTKRENGSCTQFLSTNPIFYPSF